MQEVEQCMEQLPRTSSRSDGGPKGPEQNHSGWNHSSNPVGRAILLTGM